jgi:hypothetical protein
MRFAKNAKKSQRDYLSLFTWYLLAKDTCFGNYAKRNLIYGLL